MYFLSKQIKFLKGMQQMSRLKTTNAFDTYQYLQKSILPTYYFQNSLPRLPIPKLENTCERYLAAQRPLLDDNSFANTEKYVKNFNSEIGIKLQQLLIEKDKQEKHTSYISEPWFEMYLKDRSPLPINYNPLLMMKPDEKKEYNDQVLRATNLIISSLRFRNALRDEYLAPEVFHMNPQKSDTDTVKTICKMAPSRIATYVSYVFKAFPLDMSQYGGLFGATRIPEEDKDRIFRSENPKHIIMLMNGHIFSVDVLDAHGKIETPSVIYSRLKHAYSLARDTPVNDCPVGSLTTANRNTWANVRHHLQKIGNGNAFRLIDSALFCLCFDDTTLNESNPIPMLRNLLFENQTNRWYDKSFSLIVAKDGTAALNFEHSWGDGVAVLRYFNEIYKESVTKPFVHPDMMSSTGPESNLDTTVHKINFELDEKAKQNIMEAMKTHSKICESLDMNYLKYEGINKDICKKSRASPDSIMQLAFQLAFFNQNRKFVATYESCSTAAFRHGRTETMRPLTSETKQFVEAMAKASKEELRKLLDACSVKHNQLTKDAAMGQGFDRHLFGLRHTADLNGIPYPDIFTDPAYAAINHNILSTSTLGSPALAAGGFGPVVNDGLGIGYNIQNEYCGCVVTNYKGPRDGPDFIDNLRGSFKQIEKILAVPKTD